MSNKVKFGLSNVHYAKATIAADGSATYATPVKWPGAVSLSVDAVGETTRFRADNMDYWIGQSNNGYSGTLESALVPESFLKDILGYVTDTDGVLLEVADAKIQSFALLFQFEGDATSTRHVLYNCSASRPGEGSATTEEQTEPQTESITLTASGIYVPAISKNLVKGRCTPDQAEKYAAWFESVHLPTALPTA